MADIFIPNLQAGRSIAAGAGDTPDGEGFQFEWNPEIIRNEFLADPTSWTPSFFDANREVPRLNLSDDLFLGMERRFAQGRGRYATSPRTFAGGASIPLQLPDAAVDNLQTQFGEERFQQGWLKNALLTGDFGAVGMEPGQGFADAIESLLPADVDLPATWRNNPSTGRYRLDLYTPDEYLTFWQPKQVDPMVEKWIKNFLIGNGSELAGGLPETPSEFFDIPDALQPWVLYEAYDAMRRQQLGTLKLTAQTPEGAELGPVLAAAEENPWMFHQMLNDKSMFEASTGEEWDSPYGIRLRKDMAQMAWLYTGDRDILIQSDITDAPSSDELLGGLGPVALKMIDFSNRRYDYATTAKDMRILGNLVGSTINAAVAIVAGPAKELVDLTFDDERLGAALWGINPQEMMDSVAVNFEEPEYVMWQGRRRAVAPEIAERIRAGEFDEDNPPPFALRVMEAPGTRDRFPSPLERIAPGIFTPLELREDPEPTGGGWMYFNPDVEVDHISSENLSPMQRGMLRNKWYSGILGLTNLVTTGLFGFDESAGVQLRARRESLDRGVGNARRPIERWGKLWSTAFPGGASLLEEASKMDIPEEEATLGLFQAVHEGTYRSLDRAFTAFGGLKLEGARRRSRKAWESVRNAAPEDLREIMDTWNSRSSFGPNGQFRNEFLAQGRQMEREGTWDFEVGGETLAPEEALRFMNTYARQNMGIALLRDTPQTALPLLAGGWAEAVLPFDYGASPMRAILNGSKFLGGRIIMKMGPQRFRAAWAGLSDVLIARGKYSGQGAPNSINEAFRQLGATPGTEQSRNLLSRLGGAVDVEGGGINGLIFELRRAVDDKVVTPPDAQLLLDWFQGIYGGRHQSLLGPTLLAPANPATNATPYRSRFLNGPIGRAIFRGDRDLFTLFGQRRGYRRVFPTTADAAQFLVRGADGSLAPGEAVVPGILRAAMDDARRAAAAGGGIKPGEVAGARRVSSTVAHSPGRGYRRTFRFKVGYDKMEVVREEGRLVQQSERVEQVFDDTFDFYRFISSEEGQQVATDWSRLDNLREGATLEIIADTEAATRDISSRVWDAARAYVGDESLSIGQVQDLFRWYDIPANFIAESNMAQRYQLNMARALDEVMQGNEIRGWVDANKMANGIAAEPLFPPKTRLPGQVELSGGVPQVGAPKWSTVEKRLTPDEYRRLTKAVYLQTLRDLGPDGVSVWTPQEWMSGDYDHLPYWLVCSCDPTEHTAGSKDLADSLRKRLPLLGDEGAHTDDYLQSVQSAGHIRLGDIAVGPHQIRDAGSQGVQDFTTVIRASDDPEVVVRPPGQLDLNNPILSGENEFDPAAAGSLQLLYMPSRAEGSPAWITQGGHHRFELIRRWAIKHGFADNPEDFPVPLAWLTPIAPAADDARWASLSEVVAANPDYLFGMNYEAYELAYPGLNIFDEATSIARTIDAVQLRQNLFDMSGGMINSLRIQALRDPGVDLGTAEGLRRVMRSPQYRNTLAPLMDEDNYIRTNVDGIMALGRVPPEHRMVLRAAASSSAERAAAGGGTGFREDVYAKIAPWFTPDSFATGRMQIAVPNRTEGLAALDNTIVREISFADDLARNKAVADWYVAQGITSLADTRVWSMDWWEKLLNDPVILNMDNRSRAAYIMGEVQDRLVDYRNANMGEARTDMFGAVTVVAGDDTTEHVAKVASIRTTGLLSEGALAGAIGQVRNRLLRVAADDIGSEMLARVRRALRQTTRRVQEEAAGFRSTIAPNDWTNLDAPLSRQTQADLYETHQLLDFLTLRQDDLKVSRQSATAKYVPKRNALRKRAKAYLEEMARHFEEAGGSPIYVEYVLPNGDQTPAVLREIDGNGAKVSFVDSEGKTVVHEVDFEDLLDRLGGLELNRAGEAAEGTEQLGRVGVPLRVITEAEYSELQGVSKLDVLDFETPLAPEPPRVEAVDQTESIPAWDVVEGEIDGQYVLQVPGSDVAALPVSGRKNAARWTVFNIETREEVTQLKKSELRQWLIDDARGKDVPPTEGAPTEAPPPPTEPEPLKWKRGDGRHTTEDGWAIVDISAKKSRKEWTIVPPGGDLDDPVPMYQGVQISDPENNFIYKRVKDAKEAVQEIVNRVQPSPEMNPELATVGRIEVTPESLAAQRAFAEQGGPPPFTAKDFEKIIEQMGAEHFRGARYEDMRQGRLRVPRDWDVRYLEEVEEGLIEVRTETFRAGESLSFREARDGGLTVGNFSSGVGGGEIATGYPIGRWSRDGKMLLDISDGETIHRFANVPDGTPVAPGDTLVQGGGQPQFAIDTVSELEHEVATVYSFIRSMDIREVGEQLVGAGGHGMGEARHVVVIPRGSTPIGKMLSALEKFAADQDLSPGAFQRLLGRDNFFGPDPSRTKPTTLGGSIFDPHERHGGDDEFIVNLEAMRNLSKEGGPLGRAYGTVAIPVFEDAISMARRHGKPASLEGYRAAAILETEMGPKKYNPFTKADAERAIYLMENLTSPVPQGSREFWSEAFAELGRSARNDLEILQAVLEEAQDGRYLARKGQSGTHIQGATDLFANLEPRKGTPQEVVDVLARWGVDTDAGAGLEKVVEPQVVSHIEAVSERAGVPGRSDVVLWDAENRAVAAMWGTPAYDEFLKVVMGRENDAYHIQWVAGMSDMEIVRYARFLDLLEDATIAGKPVDDLEDLRPLWAQVQKEYPAGGAAMDDGMSIPRTQPDAPAVEATAPPEGGAVAAPEPAADAPPPAMPPRAREQFTQRRVQIDMNERTQGHLRRIFDNWRETMGEHAPFVPEQAQFVVRDKGLEQGIVMVRNLRRGLTNTPPRLIASSSSFQQGAFAGRTSNVFRDLMSQPNIYLVDSIDLWEEARRVVDVSDNYQRWMGFSGSELGPNNLYGADGTALRKELLASFSEDELRNLYWESPNKAKRRYLLSEAKRRGFAVRGQQELPPPAAAMNSEGEAVGRMTQEFEALKVEIEDTVRQLNEVDWKHYNETGELRSARFEVEAESGKLKEFLEGRGHHTDWGPARNVLTRVEEAQEAGRPITPRKMHEMLQREGLLEEGEEVTRFRDGEIVVERPLATEDEGQAAIREGTSRPEAPEEAIDEPVQRHPADDPGRGQLSLFGPEDQTDAERVQDLSKLTSAERKARAEEIKRLWDEHLGRDCPGG